jgi:hypothetical protein
VLIPEPTCEAEEDDDLKVVDGEVEGEEDIEEDGVEISVDE